MSASGLGATGVGAGACFLGIGPEKDEKRRMSEVRETLSAAEARRIALTAQGFGRARIGASAGAAALRRVLSQVQLLQIDSVNVLTRAHYLPLYSRLGAYPQALLDKAAWSLGGKPRTLFEYWAHEASLLPFELQPLLRWRMARALRGEGMWSNVAAHASARRAEAEALLARIRDEGPLAASEVSETKGQGGWWGWSDAKRSLEWLFWSGQVVAATRRSSFERLYDLPERVLPKAVLDIPTPPEADAHRALLLRAAQSLGVATAGDLRDYFRQKPADALPRIAELVESGDLVATTVEGWKQPAYRHRDARMPRRVAGQALLAPFDPLIWERSRAQRLFGLDYRIEIYVPADKRVHGYYVLPFLLGGQIVARLDLKADRQRSRLLVQSAHLEARARLDVVAEPLAAELRLMAGWLGLEAVQAVGGGDLADRLRALA